MEVMTLTSLASEVEKGGLFLSNLGGESRVCYFSVSPKIGLEEIEKL